ncbi:amidohydrolase family protein [Fodinibius sp. AD559]|uniref:amidohydrolase family protein n=1 Tax=Fodinibius sp. AD559 TaxID=3424179 RepID=UPI0040469FC6
MFCRSSAVAQPTLVIENGRVITGNGTVFEQASVVVAGDSIYSVTQETVEAPDARRIDASGKTVLPGLIDAHVHLTIPPQGRDSTAVAQHLKGNVPSILQGFLDHGITTVRSTGSYWPLERKLRDRIADGELDGPRMITSGPVFTAEGGHPATTVCEDQWSGLDTDRPNSYCRAHLAEVVSGSEEARSAVRRLSGEGVDFIKLVSDSVTAPVQIDQEIVGAIVEEAHSEGLRAVGHVYEAEHMERYAKMGMDGFVHSVLPATIPGGKVERLAQVLADEGTPVTTTLSVILLYAEGGTTNEHIDTVLEGESPARETGESLAREMNTFAEAGVPVVVGTDWWSGLDVSHPAVQPGMVTITEMEMLRWGGMSQEAIIEAATTNAAQALEMGDQVGMLEEGKLADLIVVDGNPLEDLSALEDVEIVIQDGEVKTSEK